MLTKAIIWSHSVVTEELLSDMRSNSEGPSLVSQESVGSDRAQARAGKPTLIRRAAILALCQAGKVTGVGNVGETDLEMVQIYLLNIDSAGNPAGWP